MDKLVELLQVIGQRGLRTCEQAEEDIRLLSEAKPSLTNADESLAELQSKIDSLNPNETERQILIGLLNKAWKTREDLEKLLSNMQSELADERQLQDNIRKLDSQLPLSGLENMTKDQVKQVKKQQLPEIKVHFLKSYLRLKCSTKLKSYLYNFFAERPKTCPRPKPTSFRATQTGSSCRRNSYQYAF